MSMLSRITRRTIMPVALLAALVLAPTAASATPAVTGVQSRAATTCGISRGSYAGAYICETSVLNFRWPDGRYETFVIGTDNQVYHAWQRWVGDLQWSGWYSMGGFASAGVYLFDSSPTIQALGGLDGRWYCNWWWGADWSGWYVC